MAQPIEGPRRVRGSRLVEDVQPAGGRPRPAQRPYILRPGEGRASGAVWSLGGHFTPKVLGDDSEGRFSLVEALAWRSTEPPLHVHRNEDEAWYVIDGRLTFYVEGPDGELTLDASSGSFVYAPAGLAHTFTVDIEPTRVLVFATPAGFERFALELGVPATGDVPPPDLAVPPPEVLGPAGARYGIDVLGPPRRLRG
jgi:mannose-6-phosphate isomerase-like protein (cupin superfamily)